MVYFFKMWFWKSLRWVICKAWALLGWILGIVVILMIYMWILGKIGDKLEQWTGKKIKGKVETAGWLILFFGLWVIGVLSWEKLFGYF